MRPIFGIVLVLGAVMVAGEPVPAEEPAGTRSEVVWLPDGTGIKVVYGPAIRRQAEVPPLASERTIVASAGRTLWLLDGDSLTACFVRKTSSVNGYRVRCVDY